jgi:hypothetical protein
MNKAEQFAALIQNDIGRYAEVIRSANIKLDSASCSNNNHNEERNQHEIHLCVRRLSYRFVLASA